MKQKKPKFWDYEKPNFIAYLLFPLASIIQILNYIKKFSKKNKFKIKTICVGNIYIGGTGKTSLCIEINKILKKKNIKSCFIKKFYKNQFDEQKILENNGKLFVSKKRSIALNEAERENYKVAILDDGLQDESIHYDKKFLCFNTLNWIGNGMTIPAGPLRNYLNCLKRYENIFLNGNLENLEKIKNFILKINPNIIFHIGEYKPVNIDEFNINDKYLVFSGIGNHQTFISMLKKNNFKLIKDLEFPDHYQYSEFDLKKIENEANKLNCKIITTEKDYLRIKHSSLKNIKYLKSELKILDEDKLIESII